MDKIDFMKMFLKMGSMTNQTDKEALRVFQERIKIFATEMALSNLKIGRNYHLKKDKIKNE